MFSSVAFTLLTVALPTVLAQSSDSGYVQGLVNELNAIGYSGAANALSRANGTSSGQQFLSQVQDGNFTVFVPNNAACELSLYSPLEYLFDSIPFQSRICPATSRVTMTSSRNTWLITLSTVTSKTRPLPTHLVAVVAARLPPLVPASLLPLRHPQRLSHGSSDEMKSRTHLMLCSVASIPILLLVAPSSTLPILFNWRPTSLKFSPGQESAAVM